MSKQAIDRWIGGSKVLSWVWAYPKRFFEEPIVHVNRAHIIKLELEPND